MDVSWLMLWVVPFQKCISFSCFEIPFPSPSSFSSPYFFPIWHIVTDGRLLIRHRDDTASLVPWSWQAYETLLSAVVLSSFFLWRYPGQF